MKKKENGWRGSMCLAGGVITIVICLAIAYAIAVSDLPPWFKFFLLKGK